MTYDVDGPLPWSFRPKTSMEMWFMFPTWGSEEDIWLFLNRNTVLPALSVWNRNVKVVLHFCLTCIYVSRWKWRQYPFPKRSLCSLRTWRSFSGSLEALPLRLLALTWPLEVCQCRSWRPHMSPWLSKRLDTLLLLWWRWVCEMYCTIQKWHYLVLSSCYIVWF